MTISAPITITLADALPSEVKSAFEEEIHDAFNGDTIVQWASIGTPPYVSGENQSDVYDIELFLGDWLDGYIEDLHRCFGFNVATKASRDLGLELSSLPRSR